MLWHTDWLMQADKHNDNKQVVLTVYLILDY